MTTQGQPITTATRTVEDTMAVGVAVAKTARPGDLIALDGELGAGKTQFVRGMAEGLGLDPHHVASPTFVISHEYEPEDVSQPVLVHVDAYRLRGPGDLDTIGWGDNGQELRDGAVVAIEWASRVIDALGPDYLHVQLEHTGDGRQITLTPHGSWGPRDFALTAQTDTEVKTTPCPICQSPATPGSSVYPFCSMRCKQIDLGRWFGEDYTISRPIEQADLEEGD